MCNTNWTNRNIQLWVIQAFLIQQFCYFLSHIHLFSFWNHIVMQQVQLNVNQGQWGPFGIHHRHNYFANSQQCAVIPQVMVIWTVKINKHFRPWHHYKYNEGSGNQAKSVCMWPWLVTIQVKGHLESSSIQTCRQCNMQISLQVNLFK